MHIARVLGVPLIAALLAACTHAGSVGGAGNTLTVAQVEEPQSLNPLRLSGFVSGELNGLLFSYLTTYDTKGGLMPQVAREVPSLSNGGISHDGLQVTYNLRHDVRWQDGAPLTARDVVFTYNAIVNPRNDAISRFGYENIRSVEAIEPYTVRVSLKRPQAAIVPFFLGGDSNYPILPAHLLARYRRLDEAPFNTQPVGSGPYRVVEWQHGDHMTLDANPRYFLGKPGIGRIVIKFVPDAQTITNELHTGEADTEFFADVSHLGELQKIAGHHLVETPTTAFGSLILNTQDPILRDSTVRRALALAIDRNAIARKILKGVADPDSGMRGLFTWAYDPSVGNVPYDPGVAADLLQRAGWRSGPEGVRMKDGKALRLVLLSESGDASRNAIATQIAAYAAKIGMRLSIREITPDLMNSPEGPFHQGRYQIAQLPIESTDDPGASWLLGCNQFPPNGFNDMRYCDPRIQRLLDDGANTTDRNRRAHDYGEVQRLLLHGVPIIFLYQTTEVDVVPDWLANYRPSMYTGQFTFAYQWARRPIK